MTTTDIYQGLGDGRNSSRVLRPPGGSSNNIFGTDAVPDYRQAPAHQSPVPTDEDNRAAGMINPKDTASSHSRLFGGDETAQNAPSPVIAPDPSEPAGVTSATKKKNAESEEDSDTSAGITTCRKRIFKNEGRDDEEEEEEEKMKEQEGKKDELDSPSVRTIAKAPRGAYNPITGEDYAEQPKSAPQGRMRQPPGGASSGLW